MGFFAASFESLLVFLAIILLSALSNWIKQRQERKQEELAEREAELPGRPLPPAAEPVEDRPRQTRDWEEELRRLFEGDREEKAPPPLPRPVSRPVVIETVETPQARPPIVVNSPRVPSPQPAPTSAKGLPAEVRRTPVLTEPRTSTASPVAKSPVASLSGASKAYERASHLREFATSRLRAAVRQTEHARPSSQVRVPREVATPEVAALLSLLRHPYSARQAILAGVVLGPPKALEDGPSPGSR